MYTIGLDVRPTEKGFKAHVGRGTGRYTSQLVRHLTSETESTASELVLSTIGSKQLSPTKREKQLLQMLPVGKRTFESQVIFPRQVGRLGVDAVHFFSHGDAPARSLMPQIVTVLDLIPLRFPELYRADKPNWRFKFARYLEYQAIRHSLGVLAISESTKGDLIELLGVAEHRIIVTPLGVGEEFSPRVLDDENWQNVLLEKRRDLGLSLERPLLLYVGGIDPRKNPVFLLRVFAELLKHCPQKPKPMLLMAGEYRDDDQFPTVLAEISRLKIADHVQLTGFVPDEQLPALYQSANITLFPSLYEGFGLPVLESMACGVPVIAGDNSSLKEVAGKSQILAPDNDLDAWVKSILELLSSSERQRELGGAGIERAQLFSWRHCARTTLAAYAEFLSNRRKRGSKNNSNEQRWAHAANS